MSLIEMWLQKSGIYGQGNMKKERKSRAFNPRYESPLQGTLSGFEHPFDRELAPSNRWVVLAHLIPRGEICGI
jgi:hypothetical protein